MTEKILVTLHENDVAPRFDLTTELLIVSGADAPERREKRMVVLPRASADQLCHLIVTEGVRVVICGGIEDTYFQYLAWKRVRVIDSVIGTVAAVLNRFYEGTLDPGTII